MSRYRIMRYSDFPQYYALEKHDSLFWWIGRSWRFVGFYNTLEEAEDNATMGRSKTVIKEIR